MHKCPVCKGSTTPFRDPQLSIMYHVCDTCQYVCKDSTTHVSAEREKKEYDHHQNTFNSTGYVARFQRLIETFIQPYKTEGAALDFGSGPGPVLYTMLKQIGFEAHHYDPYYYPDKSYLDHRYDVITMTEVIEHLKDPKSVLNALKPLLKPSGVLVITTEFRPESLDEFLTWWYRRDVTHLGFFNAVSMHALFTQTGFTIRSTNHRNTIVVSPTPSD